MVNRYKINLFFLRGLLGWFVDIMIDGFFIPTRNESHEHVKLLQYTDSTKRSYVGRLSSVAGRLGRSVHAAPVASLA